MHRFLRQILFFLAAVISLHAAEQTLDLMATANKPVLFAYGSWDGKTTTIGNQLIAAGVTSQGGGGWNESLNLSADASKLPALRLRCGPANQAAAIKLILRDTSGHKATWNYQLPSADEHVHTLLPDSKGSLQHPDKIEDGDLLLGSIMQWQLCGDWSGKAVDIAFDGLTLVPVDSK